MQNHVNCSSQYVNMIHFINFSHFNLRNIVQTRMHSSRMRTARSLIISPYLIVSHTCPPGATTHAPQSNHACPPGSNHAPPWSNPACPPGATTHAPPQSNHACPPQEQPCTPHSPQSNHACPPVNRMTSRCKNITLPQTSFAGGKYHFR